MSTMFKREWMPQEQYKTWLMPAYKDSTEKNSSYVWKHFSFSNMEEEVLQNYSFGKKHECCKTAGNWFT